MRKYLAAFVLLLACLSAVGCNRVQDAFDQRPLGQSLAAVPPSDAVQECSFGWQTRKFDLWLLPLAVSIAEARGLKDDDGRSVVRSFLELNSVHWGLFVAGSCRAVIEAEIPPEQFVEATPEDEQVLKEMGTVLLITQLFSGLMSLGGAPETPAPDGETHSPEKPPRDIRLSEVIDGVQKAWYGAVVKLQTTDAGGQAHPDTRESKDTPRLAQLARDLAAADQTSVVVPPPAARYPHCAAEYICTAVSVMDLMPGPDDELGMVTRMYAAMGGSLLANPVMTLMVRPEAFRGITKPGFVWTGTDDDTGNRIEVRNLGDRRVRIEVSNSLLRPPL